MTECLPDLPRFIRQCGDGWEGAHYQIGPWRPIPAPQSGLPWKADGPAVQSREPASVAAEAKPLSPAAQAIVKAFDDRYELLGPLEDDWQEQCLAATLRAVADQVAPKCATATTADYRAGANNERIMVRSQLLAIADELEGANA